MAYAIMRAKKLKTMGSVAASMQHCYRERQTLNADALLTPSNEHQEAQSTDEAMGKLRELLPEQRRKDAVLVIEYMMTASPEWWAEASQQQQKEFFDQSKQWLTDKFGAENIITASIHRDETTPHLSAFVVPLTKDGRLSAKEYIGNRQQMTTDQTTYALGVKHLGMDRGIERSLAKHQTIKQHYTSINKTVDDKGWINAKALEPRVLKKGFFTDEVETPGEVANRISRDLQAFYSPAVAKASVSAQEQRKSKELRDTLSKDQKATNELLGPLRGLSKEQKAEVMQLAKGFQAENQLAKQLKIEQKKQMKIGLGKGIGF